MNMVANEKLSAVRFKQAEVEKANSNTNYWRQEFQNMRSFFEQKLAEKNRLLQQSSNPPGIADLQKNYDQTI
jgi:hypothetical protein